MADGEGDSSQMRCFVVASFGSTSDDQRRSKQVLRHLIQKVLADRFDVTRADEIDEEGLITNQIIEHLIDDELVVADLTDLNPNVFYEVAVRHAARKPIIHLISQDQEIPFDVANMRAIPYALNDPDTLETAQEELERKVAAIEKGGWRAAPNPVSAARDVWLLKESEQPEVRQAGDVLAALGELRDEVRSLGRRVSSQEDEPGSRTESLGSATKRVLAIVKQNDPISEDDLATRVPLSGRSLQAIVERLIGSQELYRVDGKLSMIPF
jgi:hypothetical protein